MRRRDAGVKGLKQLGFVIDFNGLNRPDMIASIVSRLKQQHIVIAAITAMTLKGSGALLTIAIFTLAARTMPPDDFGKLAIWFNAMGFLGIAAVFGQETLIARSWGQYQGQDQPEIAHAAYRFGWQRTLISGAIFSVIVLLVAPLLPLNISIATAVAAAAFLFAQTLLHFFSHATRVIVGLVISETNRELTWRLVLLATVIWAVLHNGLTPAAFMGAGAFGMSMSIAIELWALGRKLKAETPENAVVGLPAHRQNWSARGRDMWLSAIVEAASLYVDVLLIGYFASPSEAGSYFVAARIANVFLMINGGLNTYTFAHSARLYFSGQTGKLQEICKTVAGAAAALGLPLLLIIFMFGPQILSLFGARYMPAFTSLMILATASYGVSLCGSASVIVLTSGHERLYSRVILVATLGRLALTSFLAFRYGALGAAIGWASISVPLAMGLAYAARKLCGVDTSVLSFLTKTR